MMNNETIMQVIAMRLEGATHREIGSKLGYHEYTISKAISRVVERLTSKSMSYFTKEILEQCAHTNVAKYIKSKQLTVERLASAINVDNSYLGVSLKNTEGMPIELARRIAKYTGKTLSWVYKMEPVVGNQEA